jgi:ATP-dependent DNA helicase DinG
MPPRARDLLGPDGPLRKTLPGYEAREAQLSMADAVERALEGDRKLVCEAGTGTGKTLAYLIPAILSGRKVVISTATKALQEQIFYKDLPLLARHAGLAADAALVKGLPNYLCLRRYNELRQSPDSLRPNVGKALAAVERWRHETATGDLADLVELSENDPLRGEISSSSETRIGSSCKHYDECFVTAMKRRAEDARILVVNHHLFFADLALRGPFEGGALPAYDAVIFDEAHQIEDIAADFFGLRVSSARVEAFLRDAERSLVLAGLATTSPIGWRSGSGQSLLFRASTGGPDGGELIARAREAATQLFAALAARAPTDGGRHPFDLANRPRDEVEAYHRFDTALDSIARLAETREGSDAIDILLRRAAQLREDLTSVFDERSRRVTWVEVTARSVTIGASPVQVADLLRTRLFEPLPSVVLTSATLATSGGFAFFRDRVGLSDEVGPVDELTVPSPFDYAANALLYIPRDLPDVQDGRFLDAAGDRVHDLVGLSGGGAFVLCTSVRAMRALHARLRQRGVPRLFLQGDAPKSALLDRFRTTPDAVLVATMSFWEGVDVPGRALRLVVIDKIPFPVPTDPIVAARTRAMEDAGANPFIQYHVPTAAIALKQGFGRLIRTATDRGVVAILDRRIVTRGYGKALLKPLPPVQSTEWIDDVEEFFVRDRYPDGAPPVPPAPPAPPA